MDMDIVEPEIPKHALELKFLLQSACSFSIQFDDSPNVVTKEQSLVVKDMEKLVENDEKIIRRITKGLQQIFPSDIYLKKALLPSVLKKKDVTFAIEQESLIRLLLRVNKLQDAVFDLIKHRLFVVCSAGEDCFLLRLLLNPLKYLPNINNAEQFSTDVLDCLELSPVPMQLEILDSLPDIIPDSCYDCVAKKLVKLLSSDDCPSEAVIECFGAFDFSEDVKKSMFNSLIDKILPKRPRCLPASLKLLFETQKGKIPTEVFLKLRDMIDSMLSETVELQLKQSIVNVIQSFSNKENIAQSCIDLVISIENPRDRKPFDVFILLILGDDTKYKEIIKKNIELGNFTPELLNGLLLNPRYLKALASSDPSLRSLIKLAGYLMKFHSIKIEKFTTGLFNAIITASVEKGKYLMDPKEIVDCLLKPCNNSDMKCVNQTLRIFWGLMEAHSKRFYDNLNKLMWLLKKIDDFDLHAARMAYTILCHIPYETNPDHPYSEVMRNEISMAVRKQLMSSKRSRKSLGIMGAIAQIRGTMLDQNAEECREAHNQRKISVQLIEIVDPPPPSIQEAVTIIESVTVLTEGIPECIGLFYDELTAVGSSCPLKIDFIMWMLRRTRSLLEKYVADPSECDVEINGLKFAPRYVFGADKGQVSLNIGLMTVEPHKYEGSPIMLLAPLFRLFRTFRMLKFPKFTDDFKRFLSCSFVLPDIENLENLNHDQLKNVVEIIFHTINYLRTITASSGEAVSECLLKTRLTLIIKLEKIFENCLKLVPEHPLPLVYFWDCSKTKQINKEEENPAASNRKKTEGQSSIQSGNHLKYFEENSIHFRDIDFYHIFFKMISMSRLFVGENTIVFDDYIIAYMLKEIVIGLRIHLLDQPDMTGHSMCGFCYISKKEESLNFIKQDFQEFSTFFMTLTKELEDLETAENLNETECDLIKCLSYALEIYFVILTATNDMPSALRGEIHTRFYPEWSRSLPEIELMLAEFFQESLHDCVLLSQAVLLYQIVELVLHFDTYDHALSEDQISNRGVIMIFMLQAVLELPWSTSSCLQYSSDQFNQDTAYMLDVLFTNFNLEGLRNLSWNVWKDFIDLKPGNGQFIASLSLINYTNFHVLFSKLTRNLQQNLRKGVVSFLGQQRVVFGPQYWRKIRTCAWSSCVMFWKEIMDIIFHLVYILMNAENDLRESLLDIFMKEFEPTLKIFTALSIPIFEYWFPRNTKIILYIVKGMQLCILSIHYLCSITRKSDMVAEKFNLASSKLLPRFRKFLIVHKHEEDDIFRYFEFNGYYDGKLDKLVTSWKTLDYWLDTLIRIPQYFSDNESENVKDDENCKVYLLIWYLVRLIWSHILNCNFK